MSETHLDHPGEISWFKGQGPAKTLGPCQHSNCEHEIGGVIAWGPNFEHYSLIECRVKDGCNGKCRGWSTEYPYGEGPQFIQREFVAVE